MAEVKEAVTLIEQQMGKRFADASNPLLFSVRSGAAVSCPSRSQQVFFDAGNASMYVMHSPRTTQRAAAPSQGTLHHALILLIHIPTAQLRPQFSCAACPCRPPCPA
jgi:hypothetical protein